MEPSHIILAEIPLATVLWTVAAALALVLTVVYRRQVLVAGERVKVFLNEVYVELKKSSWPTWIELRDSTIVVIIAVAALAAYVGVADYIFVKIIAWLTSR